MPAGAVRPRPFANRQSVMDVPPVLGRGIGRIDAERFDDIDRVEDFLDFRPAGETQQALPAGTNKRHGRVALARTNGAQDVDPRNYRAVVVGCPTNEGEDASWPEGDDAALLINDAFLRNWAEADPVLDAFFDESQFNMRKFAVRLARCRK